MKAKTLPVCVAFFLLCLCLVPYALRVAGSQDAPPKSEEPPAKPGEAERRLHFKQKRLPEGEEELSAERTLAALERMRQMPAYSTAQITIPICEVAPSRSAASPRLCCSSISLLENRRNLGEVALRLRQLDGLSSDKK